MSFLCRNRGLCSEAVPILELGVVGAAAAEEHSSLKPEAALLLAECLRKRERERREDKWRGSGGGEQSW